MDLVHVILFNSTSYYVLDKDNPRSGYIQAIWAKNKLYHIMENDNDLLLATSLPKENNILSINKTTNKIHGSKTPYVSKDII